MEVTWLRRAVAASLGVVALVVMVPAAGAITGSLSFRNSRQPVPGAAGSVNLTIARVGCFPTSFRPAALTQRPLTFAAALARANRLVGSKGARYTKLKRSRFVRTSLGGQRLATAAGLKGSPKGALAALHLSVGRDGSIRDAGWRAGPKAPLGKSDIVDIPIIKSAAPSGGLPTFGS